MACPRHPAPVPDGQHLLRPEEEGKGETPRGVGLPFPHPWVLPAPSRAESEAFHGLGQVCGRENPADESRKRLSGRCNMCTCSGNGTQERAVQDLLCLVDLYLVYLI